MQSVTTEIVDIKPHPNADTLDIATVLGYTVVVRKGKYKQGELITYILEKSVLPDDLIEKYECRDYLTGSKKNRVRDVRLRGIVSQGMILPYIEGTEEGQVLDNLLKVTKYEVRIPAFLAGRVKKKGDFEFPVFSMENIRKFKPHAAEQILHAGQCITVTEKIHGTFCWFMVRPNGEWEVTSRGRMLSGLVLDKTDEHNLYVQTVKSIIDRTDFSSLKNPVHFYGEIYGPSVQDLGYGLENRDTAFRLFDVYEEGHGWIDGDIYFHALTEYAKFLGVESVPIAYRGSPIDLESLFLYATGSTLVCNKSQIREGVVLRTKLGRYKVINPDYLTRKNATEYN